MSKYDKLSYEELMKIQFDYIDKIDLEPYINKYEDLDDLWDAVEGDYDNTELTHNDFLEDYIFNWLSRYELSEYIKNKYGIRYKEETIYRR